MFNPENIPAWVSEGSIRKYHRGVAQLTKENADRMKLGQPVVPMTEEAVKELYIKWAGKVLEVPVEAAEEAPVEKVVPAKKK